MSEPRFGDLVTTTLNGVPYHGIVVAHKPEPHKLPSRYEVMLSNGLTFQAVASDLTIITLSPGRESRANFAEIIHKPPLSPIRRTSTHIAALHLHEAYDALWSAIVPEGHEGHAVALAGVMLAGRLATMAEDGKTPKEMFIAIRHWIRSITIAETGS